MQPYTPAENQINSYSKPLQITHRFAAVCRKYGLHLVYQEKVDGSQFSFRKDKDGTLHFRSRRVAIDPEDPGMFSKGVEAVKERAERLVAGWTYRGEYLSRRKHNVLNYDRVPEGHVAIFDIDRGNQDYIQDIDLLKVQAESAGFECVPTWRHDGMPPESWLERTSFLGGHLAEGYVVKDHNAIDPGGKVVMAKVVRPSFKEIHRNEWKQKNPSQNDFIEQVIEGLRTEARWQKQVQHLREEGVLVDAPQDIGRLIKELHFDIEQEAESELKDLLWDHFRKRILRGASKGFGQWYKDQLDNLEV